VGLKHKVSNITGAAQGVDLASDKASDIDGAVIEMPGECPV